LVAKEKVGSIPDAFPTAKFDRLQVWPDEPVIVPPDVYVGLSVVEEKVGSIPDE
jgi:hypothetical protein